MTKPTIEAAIIEANRAKNPEKRVTDYNHRAKCMDVLIEAARFRLPRKPRPYFGGGVECPNCGTTIDTVDDYFCFNCGQALDWT